MAAKDEAFFASSNSNIDIIENNVWIVSGGSTSRILFSNDLGESWTVFNTPVISGVPMKGAYTLDFNTTSEGIIAGGDYDNKSNSEANKAFTTDGGNPGKLQAVFPAPVLFPAFNTNPNQLAKLS